MYRVLAAFTGTMLLAAATGVPAQTLKGSRVAMVRQYEFARQQDFTFLRNSAHVRKFADLGLLVRVSSNSDYQLKGVSFPYARPALKTFLARLAQQYRAACGEPLVVTSLTRPLSEQPNNASDLSVHPAGMAVDLRVSKRRSCERWLAKTLLSLEENEVLDATREKRPPHFHVALFPEPYIHYVNRLASPKPVRLASNAAAVAEAAPPATEAVALAEARSQEQYEVNRGDSLWAIARRYGTTVAQLKEMNRLRSTRIAAGQVITVPPAGSDP